MVIQSNTNKKIKQKLISNLKKELKKQLGDSFGEFKSINSAKQYAIDNNIEPIIIISSDNSELVLLY